MYTVLAIACDKNEQKTLFCFSYLVFYTIFVFSYRNEMQKALKCGVVECDALECPAIRSDCNKQN